MTKIFSISCSKNESDIVETFIRVNSRIVDIFIFIDDSTDSTKTILNKLIEEGFDILIFGRSDNSPYDQGEIMTSALREGISFGGNGDFFIPLDCDEFITHVDKKSFFLEMMGVPKNHVGFQFWTTYIPISENFNFEKENGLQKSFKQKEKADSRFGKIIIPFDMASNIVIGTGSHRAFHMTGGLVNSFVIPSCLAHFPVRDSLQIIRKTITALDGLVRKKSRGPKEGFHVYDALRKIIQWKFKISLIELQKIANGYADQNTSENITLGDYPVWPTDYTLKYQSITNADQTLDLEETINNLWKNPFFKSELLELQK
jgi:hypothetical protein